MELSGKTRVCGIIGDPVDHTLSPAMHNAAFQELSLDFVYVAFRVRKGALRNAITGARSLDIHGLNVTMPHKTTVIDHLDETNPTTEAIGAVNTILNHNGNLEGHNTDGTGALTALEENNVRLEDKKVLLLGAGGAGKAIAFHAAQEVKELTILNRTAQKANELAAVLRQKSNKKIRADSLSAPLIREKLEDADILINATSVGMYPDVDKSPVDPRWLTADLCVMDIVYDPIETKLAQDAKAVGAKVISGVEMLVHQGAASFEIWTGQKAPVQVMNKAILTQLSESSGAR